MTLSRLLLLLAFLALPLGAQEHAPGRLLVAVFSDTTPAERQKLLDAYGLKQSGTVADFMVLRAPPKANLPALVAQLEKHPRVRAVQLDQRRARDTVPNDPAYGSGWHLPVIGAPAAWDFSTGQGLMLAVCDSGVDAAHPDLVVVTGWNSYDNNANAADVYGHGTKVAGSAAMTGNNALGGTGVAFRARIWPGRVTSPDGWGYDSLIADCITRAANAGARGANVSFGGVCSSPVVISAAQYMRSKGGVVVASSGNTGGVDNSTPSDAITCVGATNSADQRTSWSTYGPGVDVVAPGENIYTTTRGGGYGGVSGTSFAAPVTLGVYALMMALNPALTPAFLDQILFETARDLGEPGKDQFHGHGRVDAAAAVARAAGTIETPDTQPPTVRVAMPANGATVGGVVQVALQAGDDRGVTKLELLINGRIAAVGEGNGLAYAWDTCPTQAVGKLRRACGGTSSITARATDAAGNTSSSSIFLNVTR